jgi:DNA replication protein DnaC
MTETPQVLLAHHLKALKLPTVLREYDKVARQCAAEGTDYPRYLLRLAELELIDRERRMVERRIKAAKFPTVKSLDSFDFAALPSLNKALVMELARSEYVERRENIIAVGNSGTGKSHIGLGLGLQPARKACRSASQRLLPSCTSCSRRAMRNDCFVCSVSSRPTSC